jgi:hypothetical protein
MSLQTAFDFKLPRGFIDSRGTLHREVRMRLATARDEIEALQDGRVQANEAYLPVVLLSRVIVRLGELPAVTPQVVESLFASDMAYLEDAYMRLNTQENVHLGVVCPHCNGKFDVQVSPLGAAAPEQEEV